MTFENIQEARQQRIAQSKEACGQQIELVAPTFKQINAALGLYDAAKNAQIAADIQACRDKQAKMEAEINALTTIEDVANYQIVW